jgi:hypothetical protein
MCIPMRKRNSPRSPDYLREMQRLIDFALDHPEAGAFVEESVRWLLSLVRRPRPPDQRPPLGRARRDLRVDTQRLARELPHNLFGRDV